MAKTHRRRHGLKRSTRGGFCLTKRCKENKYKAIAAKANKIVEEGKKKVESLEQQARRNSAKIKYDLGMVKNQMKHALARSSHA